MNYNKVLIAGHVGRDPEIRTTNGGEMISFTLACNEGFKKDGEWKEKTTWIPVVMFKPSDYLKGRIVKGANLWVEGSYNSSSYEKDGVKKYFTNVTARSVQPLDRSGASTPPAAPPDPDVDDDLPF